MKLLIVDDSAFMRMMIKNALKDQPHEIKEAASGEEAIKAYQEFKPSLVFMDVVMPGMLGIDALREIKKLDAGAKVVMCTSVGGQEKIISEAVEAGATDFIVKPFKPEDIVKMVQHFS